MLWQLGQCNFGMGQPTLYGMDHLHSGFSDDYLITIFRLNSHETKHISEIPLCVEICT